MPDESPVLLAQEGQVALLTLNRPRVRNALDHAAIDILARHVDHITHDPTVHAVVVTGGGDRAFSAGADLKALDGLDDSGARDWIIRGHAVFTAIEHLPKPVVAAINGFALGGGLELALACDVRLAAEGAVFGLPEVSLGWLPGWGGLRRLPALIGIAHARDLVLSARQVDTTEALRMGLISRVVPPDALRREALALAEQMASYRPRAVALAKQALLDPRMGRDFDEGALVELRHELHGQGKAKSR